MKNMYYLSPLVLKIKYKQKCWTKYWIAKSQIWSNMNYTKWSFDFVELVADIEDIHNVIINEILKFEALNIKL